jgi:hypothetical protein
MIHVSRDTIPLSTFLNHLLISKNLLLVPQHFICSTVNPMRHIWHKLILVAARSRHKCYKTECEANLAHMRRTLCAGWGHMWGIYASCVFVMAHMRHICLMWACDGTHVAYLPHVSLWWFTWGIFASCVLVMAVYNISPPSPKSSNFFKYPCIVCNFCYWLQAQKAMPIQKTSCVEATMSQ